MTAPEQSDIVAFLASPQAHGGAAVERIDTHISHVFLAGDRVLKLKRAVVLSYVDFSTVAKRKAACDAELAINRRTAPEIYRGVVPVTREADGTLAIDGAGEPVDWLVAMRRFDQAGLFDTLATNGTLTVAQVVAAAETIARFHAGAETVAGGAAPMARIIDGNGRSIRRAAIPLPLSPVRAAALDDACRAALARIAPLLDRRAAQGGVRDGHGDLHLRNIAWVDGKPLLFDAIEFDPALRQIDVYYDFAFLLMDLLHRGLDAHANRALNAYAAAGGDRNGLAALPLFIAVRAVIRGHIAATLAGEAEADAAAARQAEAEAYFAQAEAALAPPGPALVAVGGLSGTGKSTIALALAPRLGPLPGALVLRSDEIRKRLAGVAPAQRLSAAYYTDEWTRRVYDTLLKQAEEALAAGHAVIADAVSGHRVQREELAAVADRARCRFEGLWLESPIAVRKARVDARSGDVSDADAAIVRAQREPEAGDLAWRRVDASGTIPDTVAAAARALADSRIALRAA